MGKKSVTVELDDETIRCLAVLGSPIEVLARLAHSAADLARRPGNAQRDQTNESLRVERSKTDSIVTNAIEEADEVVRVARQRADQVVQIARDEADREGQETTASKASSEPERSRADGVLETERSDADAVLETERSDADAVLEGERLERRDDDASLAVEREATDKNLIGERVHSDKELVGEREANEQLVSAAMLAQGMMNEADAAKERAEETERELREVAEFREMFIGILGHDLRNPLGGVVLSAALLLRRGHLDEQDAATVARIIRSSQRMTRMIAQLLDLTRARLGGGLPIEPAPADLREICQNLADEFEAAIQLELEGDLTGTWDQDRLAEVLSNLAGNAIEYATPGTVVIARARTEGAEVVVEISNQGDLIPADVLAVIFEPFRRAQQRKKSATGNLGLGLYIAQQIVLSHGGTLDAHCAGGTTTFVVRLPRCPPGFTP